MIDNKLRAIAVRERRYREALRVANGSPADQLEAQGWEVWLQTIWPFWFAEDFSAEHEQYWEQLWNVLQDIKAGRHVDNARLTCILALGRGLGKSACAEAGRILRGSILNAGYSLMVSETEDQAQEHLGNCRILIEHPDSKLLDYYPQMAIAEHADALKGMPTADRKEMFICKNGYILRAKGYQAKMRGLRVGIHRPTDICFDDIDDVSDSLAVAQTKLRTITASILPVQARESVTVTFAQNLITEHSVINQILTGKTDALAERTIIGVANAFRTLNISSDIDAEGRLRHIIQPDSEPSWAGLDINRAQKFLDNSGLETFLAEYQNDFGAYRAGKVIPEYNEEAQIITWSDFERVFGERRIPAHWKCKAGLDVGYSEGQYPHYSGWVFVATAAQNTEFPGLLFIYRARGFKATSIDDQAEEIKSVMWPGERVETWQMSHERTGEMLTLNQKYDLPFHKFQYFGAEDGVAQWRHLSKIDENRLNPFTREKGSPLLFYIVDDDQKKMARDDKGLRLFREQVSTWDYVPVKLTESGRTIQKPSKVNDDLCDATKGILALFGPGMTALTSVEKFERKLEARGLSLEAIEKAAEADKLAMLQVRTVEARAFTGKKKRSMAVVTPFRR